MAMIRFNKWLVMGFVVGGLLSPKIVTAEEASKNAAPELDPQTHRPNQSYKRSKVWNARAKEVLLEGMVVREEDGQLLLAVPATPKLLRDALKARWVTSGQLKELQKKGYAQHLPRVFSLLKNKVTPADVRRHRGKKVRVSLKRDRKNVSFVTAMEVVK